MSTERLQGDPPVSSTESKAMESESTALMKMLDLRTANLGAPDGHSERVAQYAKAIGKQLDLAERMMKDLVSAAVLHDIGKVGISPQIVDKLGRLSDREFEIMRLHSTIAIRMLEKVEGLENALPMIKHHHERFDGKGYPDGLKGTNIPLGARVIAVAETFDVLTSNLPWREPLGLAEAIDEIVANSGSQFDPMVVEAFRYAIKSCGITLPRKIEQTVVRPKSSFRIRQ